MVNALNLVRSAVKEWRKNRGDQTTYLKCQHFDGWYVQWAYEGFTDAAEDSIKVYQTASDAARHSEIFTKDVNDPDIKAGDRIYWDWGTKGHIGTVVGRDGKRVLVTHTSFSGDAIMHLGNNVRVSHADTIGLDVYGVSHTNGKNKPMKGLTPYNINQKKDEKPSTGKPAGSSSSSSDPKIDLRDGWAWYKSAAEAKSETNPHGPQWTGEKLARGVYSVKKIADNGAVQIKANDGSLIWISPKAKSRISGKSSKPTKIRKISFDGRAWYTSATNAKNEWDPHGPRWTREQYLVGTYDVIEIHSNGAVAVRAKDGSKVWVSPRNLPAIR